MPRFPFSYLFAYVLSLKLLCLRKVLSTGLGRIVPNLISRKHTNSAATGIFHDYVSCSLFVRDCLFGFKVFLDKFIKILTK